MDEDRIPLTGRLIQPAPCGWPRVDCREMSFGLLGNANSKCGQNHRVAVSRVPGPRLPTSSTQVCSCLAGRIIDRHHRSPMVEVEISRFGSERPATVYACSNHRGSK